jgi:Domain of unknown function (DUF4158)
MIFQCRDTQNRLGFALLLGGVRLTGRFPKDLSFVSANLLEHLYKQFHLRACFKTSADFKTSAEG